MDHQTIEFDLAVAVSTRAEELDLVTECDLVSLFQTFDLTVRDGVNPVEATNRLAIMDLKSRGPITAMPRSYRVLLRAIRAVGYPLPPPAGAHEELPRLKVDAARCSADEELPRLKVDAARCSADGGPWCAYSGFMAKGVHVATVPSPKLSYARELFAVSSCGRLIVVTTHAMDQLAVYRTMDGSLMTSFGERGTGPRQFDRISNLCMTAWDTILVSEDGNKRIQEVTPHGKHMKFFPVDGHVYNMAIHGDKLAVRTSPTHIQLYSYSTGAVIRRLDAAADRWYGMFFSLDGSHLVEQSGDGSVTLLSVNGHSVRHISVGRTCLDMVSTAAGDLMGINEFGAYVFSITDGRELRSWGVHGDGDQKLCRPCRIKVSGNRLYILDGQVKIFE